MTDGRPTTEACPHCDTAGRMYKRVGENTHADDPDAPYYCWACGRSFDEPVVRPLHPSPATDPSGSGAGAGRMPDTDPELLDRVREKMGIEPDI